ncbi:alginate lyase family protein [Ammoniphilus sp. 3BR4]|uniref:alginate lyase family protein n=1 Tax=Ammoniphilus sp. 3BR4 TaxID=3158265 RepID=UPI0034678B19
MDFVYLDRQFVEKTRQCLSQNQGKWKKIRHELKKMADIGMKKGPWSVTFFPGLAASGDPHDYYCEAPYWWPNPKDSRGPYIRRDGLERPDRHRHHWLSLDELSRTILVLCCGGYYLRNKAYLERAAELLRIWFLDPATRMNPHMEYAEAIPGKYAGRHTGMIALWRVNRIVHALGFLSEYPDWKKELDGVAEWIDHILTWILKSKKGKEESHSGNNHAAWWVTHVATYGSFLGKRKILKDAFKFYQKEIVAKQIAPDGQLPQELKRTKSLSYCLLNLDAQALLCEIAYQNGSDLWNYRTDDGKGINAAIEWLLPYLKNPSSWKYQQIDGFIPDEQLCLQYASIRLKKSECRRINGKLRGSSLIRDDYPLGPLPLLPGYEF